jgi:hypothetical protein
MGQLAYRHVDSAVIPLNGDRFAKSGEMYEHPIYLLFAKTHDSIRHTMCESVVFNAGDY